MVAFFGLVILPLWLAGAFYTAVSRADGVYDGAWYKVALVFCAFGAWPGILSDDR